MSLTMTADEYWEAYPNGMDADDMEVWDEAVARDQADECDCTRAEDGYCPDCGYDAVMAAEQAIGC